ncbi:hypothetical protein SCHPADRAFT_572950 [Schizopora paradoxa]|uniref:Uncharacterized protein n=1 Tax=Schizopora paradoxa TaxID=27342 RepID=A0A0H2RCS7_9AGAM|nr:hypothetical protein SCHPADRAFT_572950 [Schizopora paradoxa]
MHYRRPLASGCLSSLHHSFSLDPPSMSSPYEPKSPTLRSPQTTFNQLQSRDGREMSSESLSETLQCSIIYYERISVEELLDHYKELCYANSSATLQRCARTQSRSRCARGYSRPTSLAS